MPSSGFHRPLTPWDVPGVGSGWTPIMCVSASGLFDLRQFYRHKSLMGEVWFLGRSSFTFTSSQLLFFPTTNYFRDWAFSSLPWYVRTFLTVQLSTITSDTIVSSASFKICARWLLPGGGEGPFCISWSCFLHFPHPFFLSWIQTLCSLFLV